MPNFQRSENALFDGNICEVCQVELDLHEMVSYERFCQYCVPKEQERNPNIFTYISRVFADYKIATLRNKLSKLCSKADDFRNKIESCIHIAHKERLYEVVSHRDKAKLVEEIKYFIFQIGFKEKFNISPLPGQRIYVSKFKSSPKAYTYQGVNRRKKALEVGENEKDLTFIKLSAIESIKTVEDATKRRRKNNRRVQCSD